MNERITVISLFDFKDLEKINNILSSATIPLCKVPFSKNVSNREYADTLPFHFTLSAGDITEAPRVKEALKKILFKEFTVQINNLEILPGKENSYVLVFIVEPNNELQELQKKVYTVLPTSKYNPANFKFHITIHISKDYEEIINLKKEIENNFKPFKLTVNKIGLFQIYPASLLKEYSGIKKL